MNLEHVFLYCSRWRVTKKKKLSFESFYLKAAFTFNVSKSSMDKCWVKNQVLPTFLTGGFLCIKSTVISRSQQQKEYYLNYPGLQETKFLLHTLSLGGNPVLNIISHPTDEKTEAQGEWPSPDENIEPEAWDRELSSQANQDSGAALYQMKDLN